MATFGLGRCRFDSLGRLGLKSWMKVLLGHLIYIAPVATMNGQIGSQEKLNRTDDVLLTTCFTRMQRIDINRPLVGHLYIVRVDVFLLDNFPSHFLN
jgi:hypothetical protein